MKRRHKPAADRAAKFAREYGSAERVEAVRGMPCVACGRGPCDNAHTGRSYTSYKADYWTIVPLCSACHHELHQNGRASFERRHEVDLAAAAIRTERNWQAECGEGAA